MLGQRRRVSWVLRFMLVVEAELHLQLLVSIHDDSLHVQ